MSITTENFNAASNAKPAEKPSFFSAKNILIGLALIISLVGLYFLSRYNYLLFHGTVEVFTIVIAIAIFTVAWNSRHIMDNKYLAFIGIAFLFVGVLDLLHTLAYRGMGVFPDVGANLATQLWVATRYVFSLSLLIPLLIINRKIKTRIVSIAYFVVTVFLILSIFYLGIFPQAYTDGSGLTAFKIVSEYIISLIFVISIGLLIKNKREFSDNVFKLLLAAMALGIATEMAFTLYTDVYGIANMVGHLLNIVSFYLIYKALVETGFSKPYDLLFRNLKQSETKLSNDAVELKQINQRLEQEIVERKKSEFERGVIIDFLQIANNSTGTVQLVSQTLNLMKKLTGCEAVGIRLKDGDDYPYYETRGFTAEHVELENKLCAKDDQGCLLRDFKGDPILECMCGNIICGRFDASKEFFTQKGSFWTNDTTSLLVSTTEADRQAHTRNRCNGEGYESVALIALHVGNSTLGLLQLNDKRKNMFTLEMIQLWERIADHLALALSKTLAEEVARERAEQVERLQVKLEEKALEVEEYASQMEALAEERLSKLKDSERLAAIGATAGMVGHDIRNPLQAIISDLFLAKEELAEGPDAEGKKHAMESIEEIEKNVDYINKIVQDLQDYARPLNPKAEESDLKLVFERLISKSGLPDNVKVNITIDDNAKKIEVDSYYLNRILYNLVTNSVQAMPNGGNLTIQAYRKANETVITVKDTGVGIPQEVQSKMFAVMFTTKSKGQGFGLPVVKRMTESLGGTVTFESQEGKGTTFIIRLPPPKS